MTPNKPRQTLPDLDPEETDEWLESLRTVTYSSGSSRARILLQEIMSEATALGIDISTSRTPYLNSISIEQQKPYPGNLEIEKKIQNNILWNAAVMVSDANRRMDGIGGHISTYASSSTLYEVGFNHIFRGKDHNGIGIQYLEEIIWLKIFLFIRRIRRINFKRSYRTKLFRT